MELNELIQQYKNLRAERELIEGRFKAEMQQVQAQIEQKLAESGLKSAKTESGQAITSQRRTVRIVDWDTFGPFANNEYPSLIKYSLDTSEALRLLDDDVAIPGTEVSTTFVLSVK